MKCPVCNKNNRAGASVCKYCGNKFIIDDSPEFGRNTVGEYKMALSKKLVYSILISAAAVVIVLVVLLVIPKKKKSGVIIIQPQNQVQQINTNRGQEPSNESVQNAGTPAQAGEQNVSGSLEAVVKDYRLRVRQHPKTRARIVGYLPKGAVVKILAKTGVVKIRSKRKYITGRWYKVHWQKEDTDGNVKDIKGWVWGDYLNFRTN